MHNNKSHAIKMSLYDMNYVKLNNLVWHELGAARNKYHMWVYNVYDIGSFLARTVHNNYEFYL